MGAEGWVGMGRWGQRDGLAGAEGCAGRGRGMGMHGWAGGRGMSRHIKEKIN